MSSVRDQFSETCFRTPTLQTTPRSSRCMSMAWPVCSILAQISARCSFGGTPVRSEDGPVMFERSPAFVLVQPRSALLCGKSCRLNAILNAQGVPTVSAPRVVAGATFN